AAVTSSSSASTTFLIAAIADAPQIANPVAVRNDSGPLTPSRKPSHRVPKNVATTTAMTTARRSQPNARTSPAASWNPSRTTPTRRRFEAAIDVAAGTEPRETATFETTRPNATAIGRAGTAGIARWRPYAAAAPTKSTTSAGASMRHA